MDDRGKEEREFKERKEYGGGGREKTNEEEEEGKKRMRRRRRKRERWGGTLGGSGRTYFSLELILRHCSVIMVG